MARRPPPPGAMSAPARPRRSMSAWRPRCSPAWALATASQPGLRAHRQGQGFGFAADRCTVTPDATANSLRIRAARQRQPIDGAIDLRLDASDTLHITTRLTNQGTAPLQVDALASANLDLPGQHGHGAQLSRPMVQRVPVAIASTGARAVAPGKPRRPHLAPGLSRRRGHHAHHRLAQRPLLRRPPGLVGQLRADHRHAGRRPPAMATRRGFCARRVVAGTRRQLRSTGRARQLQPRTAATA